MAKADIVTLDLKFQGLPQAIAAYVIRHSSGAVLIECGPGSTVDNLAAALSGQGLAVSDVTHVLLTHIHLDHAGAAGWVARHGAQIIVHPKGAPHLISPEKLLASAKRIYGDRMDALWGEFLPVSPDRIKTPADGEEIVVGQLRFIPLDTPGHADHHYAYRLDDVCFTGDVGGVRMPGYDYLRVPMPPPELHFEKWRQSLVRLQRERLSRIAPTHFGLFDDPAWQLGAAVAALDEAEQWLEASMQSEPTLDDLRARFVAWMNDQATVQKLTPAASTSFDLANPLGMSADGMFRYWKKVRQASS